MLPETEKSGDGLVVACLQEVLHVAQVHHQAPRHTLHLQKIRTFKFMSISVLVGESVHLNTIAQFTNARSIHSGFYK
jgi:hypothetical protein